MPVRRSQICVCVSKAYKYVLFQGHTLDIALKKVKHRVVESMASDTADALGLSRAILCNDLLVKKLNRLENSGNLYKKMIRHLSALLNAYYRVARSQKGICLSRRVEIYETRESKLSLIHVKGHTLDIALKKVKHRVVESMASDTADALGLSRAILCNDLLVKKLNRLENSGNLYKKMIRHLSALLNAYYRVARSQKGICLSRRVEIYETRESKLSLIHVKVCFARLLRGSFYAGCD
ncbi:PRKCA-binding protein [Toxocara canis]|uniref:PRKCA-binding protein n=1 Tax=Toxocara canis TaxID=6265 RepID=A0A0B2VD73_TOXCA|nr:PRKCA-binding protein [Toxocara canis]